MNISYILALPLFSAIFCGIFNKKLPAGFASFIASICLVASAVLSLETLYLVHNNQIIFHEVLMHWFSIGNASVNWGVYADELTAIMFVVVNLVSSIVHIYSTGYMKEDENLPRFMAYLSLFTFFMLLLVSSDNLMQLFVGWEGVGLCSYLLIGFWYKKESASSAAMKAFIVNRVGDFAFIIGILALLYFTGSLDFAGIFASLSIISYTNLDVFGWNLPLIEIISMFLFIGAMGKSAQIGLHVWLPDAMEGPTPVSALIHAATMVTAGVFLVARTAPIFELAPFTCNIILYVGAITCLFAASIAIAQDDIKRIIAYSTCSQLGYMFMAAGSLAFKASIFHLVTHAFFKAMLFLGAGIVIHAVHEQDINKMGGLRKYMPVTYLLFIIGSLAIMGIYPFSGYYSKDMILESVYFAHHDIPFMMGIIAAFFTAIYSMKIIVKVFHGTPPKKKVKEWSNVMLLPLFILAFASIQLGSFLFGYFADDMHHEIPDYIKYMPMGAGIAGMIIGWIIYEFNMSCNLLAPLYKLLKNKYYFDEIYDRTFVKLTFGLSSLARLFDKGIDFCPNSASHCSRGIFRVVSKMQNGYIFTYVFYILLGLLGIMLTWILKFYL